MDQTQIEFFKAPDFCPACSTPLDHVGDFLYCKSKSCPQKLSGAVKVWVARLGLLHWGDAVIESICDTDKPTIFGIVDLYNIDAETLAPHTSGKKMADKLLKVLHDNKTISLELFFASLNIQNLALSTATDIVQEGYVSVESIVNMTYEQLKNVPNIGPITARTVFEGFAEKRNIIFALSRVLTIKPPSTGPLKDKSFCITGATKTPRKSLQKEIMDAGGIVKSSVGKGLDFLVTNEDASFGSSKLEKAAEYGTRIITEQELYSMMGSPPSLPRCKIVK